MILFKIDKRRTQTNKPEDQKLDDNTQSHTSKKWHRLTICVKKRGRKRTSIKDWVDTSKRIWRLYWKEQKQNNYSGNISTTIDGMEKWEEKLLWSYFKPQTKKIPHKKTYTWLQKGNLLRKTEYLLMAAENNAVWFDYMNANINNAQKIVNVDYVAIETKPSIR